MHAARLHASSVMRPTLVLLALHCIIGVTAVTGAPVGRQTRHESSTGRRYILYVPADYSADRAYPLVVSSHGSFQNGDTEMDGTGPNSCCDRGTPTWPTLAEEQDVIVVCPDMIGAYGTGQFGSTQLAQLASDDNAIMSILSEVQAAYHINTQRQLITGFSGGGHVAHYVGLRHPTVFRGLCARHGNFNVQEVPSPLPDRTLEMNVYIFTGSDDGTSGTDEAIAWYASQGFARVRTEAFGTYPSNQHTTDRHHALSWFLGLSLFGTDPSGHYLTYMGQPLLLVGDSGTQVVMQNVNINHRQWVDDCAARGIRALHIWAFVPPRQKQDGSTIEARYGYVYPGITPWARKTSGPAATDQLPQWDLQTFDEGPEGDTTHYWPRLRDLCRHAETRRMVVGITVFFGWPKHNTADRPDWSYHPLNMVNGGPVTDNGSPVTQVQLIDTPGTEIWSQTWSDGWSSRKKTQWIWERYAKKLIDEAAAFDNVFFVFMDEHSYSEGNMGDHFRDFFQSRGQVWVDWNPRRSSVDWVMSDSPGGDKNADAVSGFARSPARPFLLLEGTPYMGEEVRTAIWTFSMGAGNYFFHGDERQETVTTGIMGYDPHVPGQDKGMYKRDWLGHASRFFNEQLAELATLAPHNELSSAGTYCLAAPGREYVVYSSIGSAATFTLDMSADAGIFDCRFYNPRNGQFNPTFQRQGGGPASFTKPDSNDWALHVVVSSSAAVALVNTSPSPAVGFLPLTISFDGSASHDSDSYGDDPQIVSYAWDFTDDGTYDETHTVPTAVHEYLAAGTYTCRLRVVDNEGTTDEVTVRIEAKQIPGDFDGDQDVDQEDFGHFQTCYSGYGNPQTDPGCRNTDLDQDGDVDLGDFDVFQSCLSGADVQAQPSCVRP